MGCDQESRHGRIALHVIACLVLYDDGRVRDAIREHYKERADNV